MNKLESNYITNLWATKYVWSPDAEGFICKVFKTRKQSLPIEEQKKLLEMKKIYFWEYIPETVLVQIWEQDYIIKQKFIKWKTLAETNISDLSAETLYKLIDLIKKYLKYYKEQWWEMDITWYQYYPWNPSAIKRKLMNFLKINQNFLASTNIMISDDWNVYMVDICESADSRIQWKIKNFLAKPFIKKTISRLENLLQKRIPFENENINNNLLNILTQ